jgi:hypothetical protein
MRPSGTKGTPAAAVPEFIDPWLGDKVNSGIGLSHQHARLHDWRAGTKTICRSWLYPPVRDLWIWLQGCKYIAVTPATSNRGKKPPVKCIPVWISRLNFWIVIKNFTLRWQKRYLQQKKWYFAREMLSLFSFSVCQFYRYRHGSVD